MNKQEKIIVTGGSGRLGRAFKKLYPDCLYPSRSELDITCKDSIDTYLQNHPFDVIVHLAAMASIPQCEANQKSAWNVNVDGTINLVMGMINYNIGAKFIYLNSACIFPGGEATSYEDSLPGPEHFYGLTKLAAELKLTMLQDLFNGIYIVRTNFTSMPWEYPAAFTDRFGTYLFAQGVAKGVFDLIHSENVSDVVHLVGDRKISMWTYATLGGSNVEKMTLADYTGPKLTKNMCLGTKNWHTYSIHDSDYDDNLNPEMEK